MQSLLSSLGAEVLVVGRYRQKIIRKSRSLGGDIGERLHSQC